MTQQNWKAGDHVCTVGRCGASQAKTSGGFSVPIWEGKVYEAVPRKRDGVLTWRLVRSYTGTRSGHKPSDKFVAACKESSSHPFLAHVYHGMPCNTTI